MRLFAVAATLLAAVAAVSALSSGNPFALPGVEFYVNPDFFNEVESSVAKVTDAKIKADMQAVSHVPSAYWLDVMAKIPKLELILEDAKRMQQKINKPVLTSFVIYDVPNRDCHALASNGELTLAANGTALYKAAYIEPIAAVLKRYASADMPIVLFIEPDSLPNIVTNIGTRQCDTQTGNAYEENIAYAIATFAKLSNVWMYVDIAHEAWLGWPDNLAKTGKEYAKVLQMASTQYAAATNSAPLAGGSLIRGFVTNSANYDNVLFENGDQDLLAESWNFCRDELVYISQLVDALSSADSSLASAAYIIDTGRGGQHNLRVDVGHWCNIKGAGPNKKGAGLGYLPRAAPTVPAIPPTNPAPTHSRYNLKQPPYTLAAAAQKKLDAYWWIKTPGESDGISVSGQGRFDEDCIGADSWYMATGGSDAPQAGQWFHPFFVNLVQQAIEIPTSYDVCNPNPCNNNGVCTASGKTPSCSCQGGWTGAYCDVAPASCNPNPCQNLGTCQNGQCVCLTGFTGSKCETFTGSCAPNPCANGGVCTQSGTNVVCKCAAGYTGALCTEAPMCSPNPCQNGGTCYGSIAAYQPVCFCPKGYAGTLCDKVDSVSVAEKARITVAIE